MLFPRTTCLTIMVETEVDSWLTTIAPSGTTTELTAAMARCAKGALWDDSLSFAQRLGESCLRVGH